MQQFLLFLVTICWLSYGERAKSHLEAEKVFRIPLERFTGWSQEEDLVPLKTEVLSRSQLDTEKADYEFEVLFDGEYLGTQVNLKVLNFDIRAIRPRYPIPSHAYQGKHYGYFFCQLGAGARDYDQVPELSEVYNRESTDSTNRHIGFFVSNERDGALLEKDASGKIGIRGVRFKIAQEVLRQNNAIYLTFSDNSPAAYEIQSRTCYAPTAILKLDIVD